MHEIKLKLLTWNTVQVKTKNTRSTRTAVESVGPAVGPFADAGMLRTSWLLACMLPSDLHSNACPIFLLDSRPSGLAHSQVVLRLKDAAGGLKRTVQGKQGTEL